MKMLYIKHISNERMNTFALSAIRAAKELGIDFTIAQNMSMADKNHMDEFCLQHGIKMIHIDFGRNPLNKSNFLARKQLLELMKREQYDFVHCNTPTGGLVGRIAAAQARVPKVIYMAHGFHFWKGAPVKNWLVYYPVERLLARLSDRVITINREDYACAQQFRYKKGGRAEYVPGVGIDVERFAPNAEVRAAKRKELGLNGNEIMLLSVGELNRNKNHRVVIEALAQWKREDVRYVICGSGLLKEEYRRLAQSLGVAEQIVLAGYQADINSFCQAADIFVFPSLREGLPVSLMEAMAAGLPCVASRIRGNEDLLPDSELLFDATDVDSLHRALQDATNKELAECEIKKNMQTLQMFSMQEAVDAMRRVYVEIIRETAPTA